MVHVDFVSSSHNRDLYLSWSFSRFKRTLKFLRKLANKLKFPGENQSRVTSALILTVLCCGFLSPGTVTTCPKPPTSSVTTRPPSRRSLVGSETLMERVHIQRRAAASGSSTSETLPRATTAARLTSDLFFQCRGTVR